ncbi:flagellar motor protein MotB [Aureibacillus halotolerans]|uniref:Chemotaxis protein MotB n=1 Tax=Aureibacillus halotolerans TaxID=1508390 RepID=A0A4R6U3T3_9BACI|nr:flagellar motor protein MotB [Aureibacillus halotolerans]TDQ39085.1 chemotaxis protein MotB [Aureibacillus halotolerans]
MKHLKNRRQQQQTQTDSSPGWMITYADVVTLILVFFILLFSISQIDSQKLDAAVQSFSSVEPMDVPETTPETQTAPESVDAPTDDQLLQKVQAYLTDHGIANQIEANRTQQGVVLVLKERVLFHSADATVLPKGEEVLSRIAGLLLQLPNDVIVEGHTDSRPISTYQFPSNWELSSARASSVIRYMISSTSLEKERFRAIGFADTQPAVSGTNAEQLAQNRRVEMVILTMDS